MVTVRASRQLDDTERQRPASQPDGAPAPVGGGAKRAWRGVVAIAICAAMVVVCWHRGSPEGAVCFTGLTLTLAFLLYHF